MTERTRGLGRKKTREEIGKGNQMTALRFQTGGRHQTSPASLQGELVKHQLSEQRHDSSTSVDAVTHALPALVHRGRDTTTDQEVEPGPRNRTTKEELKATHVPTVDATPTEGLRVQLWGRNVGPVGGKATTL